MAHSADAMNRANMDQVRKIMQDMDVPKKRTISAAAYLSVKHALPHTCIGHTIIHENPCQERVLNIELDRIKHRSKLYTNVYEISRRTFLDRQSRKQRKWKQQDDMRIASMNFPTIRASAVEGRASVEVMYTSPRYKDMENNMFNGKPLLPYMLLRRERTEFIRSHKKISTTKLPDVLQTNMLKLKRYNSYCGDEMSKIQKHEMANDRRFESLTDSLSANKAAPSEEINNPALKRKQSVDPESAWFMDDDDDVSEGSIIPKRGVSRESMRKATVVFPSVAPSGQRSQPMSAASKHPSIERERTQYHILLKNSSVDKPRAVAFPESSTEAPKIRSSATTQPQGKVVDLDNLELKEDKAGDSAAQVRKGILKSPKKRSSHETADDKRDKIKQDLKTKDLKELKETYGPLKELTDENSKNSDDNKKQDPRDENTFHSPTMERRFSVKSATRS